MDNPVRVVFVRHGQTNWNLEGRMQGQLSEGAVPVLTELGVSQAHAVADYLKENYQHASSIYTSDLKRAVQVLSLTRPLFLWQSWPIRSPQFLPYCPSTAVRVP